jgi:hypothetical protein
MVARACLASKRLYTIQTAVICCETFNPTNRQQIGAYSAPGPPRRRWPGFRSRGGPGFQEAGVISPVGSCGGLQDRVDDRNEWSELRPLRSLGPHIARRRPNSGTFWKSCPGSVRKPAPPRAGSSLRQRQTVEPLRKSPPRTSPAIPLRIRLRKGSASKVAGFYSATRDRVTPPLHGLLLLRRTQFQQPCPSHQCARPGTFLHLNSCLPLKVPKRVHFH